MWIFDVFFNFHGINIFFFQFTRLTHRDVYNLLCWTRLITTQQHHSRLEHFLFHSVASNSPAKGLLPWNYSCLDFFSMFTSKNSSHLNQYNPPRSSAGSHWTVRFHVFFTKNLRNHWNVNYSVGKRKRAVLFFFLTLSSAQLAGSKSRTSVHTCALMKHQFAG